MLGTAGEPRALPRMSGGGGVCSAGEVHEESSQPPGSLMYIRVITSAHPATSGNEFRRWL